MGVRKRTSAQARKEALKTQSFAKLTNVPTSPRKMRLVADLVRGVNKQGHVVGTLADSVATALGGGTQALEHRRAVHENRADVKLAVFSLAFVLGFPVGDSRAEELLHAGIVIERTLKLITITVCTSRPGVIIGKGGAEVDKLKEELKKITDNLVWASTSA